MHVEADGSLAKNALEVDQPIAALIADLKARGLLERTLVLWGGEFGRTPYAEIKKDAKETDKPGRDHHHTAFSILLAAAKGDVEMYKKGLEKVDSLRSGDRILIAAGVLMLVASFVLAIFGYGNFWVPPALLRLVGG